MKLLIPAMLLLLNIYAYAQSKKTITIGTADSVYSNILHEERKLWVSMPDTTSPDGVFYPQHYPVVYLLDGDENHFAQVALMLRQMGGGNGNLSFPSMILVGIPNTNRARDLSPTHVESSPAVDSYSAAQSGGGEKFINFIENELMQHIDSLYPTAPYHVLIGHSLGGLMAIYSLINHPNLFSAYLAIDPSMWWDNQAVLKQALNVLGATNNKGKSLFVGIANTMQTGMDTTEVQSDNAFNSLHIRSILQLVHYLKANAQNNLRFNYKYYADYSHDGVELIAEYDGLASLFAFYSYDFNYGEFFNPLYKGDTLLAVHYKELSTLMGYNVYPPEQFVSALSFQLIDMKQFDRALYFLQLNMQNYPNSAMSYNNMAHYYLAKGDVRKAVDSYQKSLALRYDAAIKQKIDDLKNRR